MRQTVLALVKSFTQILFSFVATLRLTRGTAPDSCVVDKQTDALGEIGKSLQDRTSHRRLRSGRTFDPEIVAEFDEDVHFAHAHP